MEMDNYFCVAERSFLIQAVYWQRALAELRSADVLHVRGPKDARGCWSETMYQTNECLDPPRTTSCIIRPLSNALADNLFELSIAAQVSFDGSSVCKTPSEVFWLFSPHKGKGAYGPPVAGNLSTVGDIVAPNNSLSTTIARDHNNIIVRTVDDSKIDMLMMIPRKENCEDSCQSFNHCPA